jgi:hypothetical protein
MMHFNCIRGLVAVFNIGLTLMAGAFILQIIRHGSPVTPELYGALVYFVDGWIWGSFQALFSVFAAIGAATGGRNGARSVLVFGALQTVLLAVLSAMAMDAPQGGLVVYGAFFVIMPVCALSSISAWLFLGERHG